MFACQHSIVLEDNSVSVYQTSVVGNSTDKIYNKHAKMWQAPPMSSCSVLVSPERLQKEIAGQALQQQLWRDLTGVSPLGEQRGTLRGWISTTHLGCFHNEMITLNTGRYIFNYIVRFVQDWSSEGGCCHGHIIFKEINVGKSWICSSWLLKFINNSYAFCRRLHKYLKQ